MQFKFDKHLKIWMPILKLLTKKSEWFASAQFSWEV